MGTFLFDHMPNCSPLKPCTACRVVDFLRKKLTPQDFKTFTVIALGRDIERESEIKKAPLSTDIRTLNLSVRILSPLRDDNIETIEDLARRTEAEILRIPIGRKDLNWIKNELAKVGWEVGELAHAPKAPGTTES